MWLGSHKTLARHVDNEVPANYRAALIFVSTLSLEMARAGKKPEGFTNHQLAKVINKDLAGGRILTENMTISAPDYSV